jgi:spore coat polysaccharide biosynthesis protein SpsF
MKFIVIIQARMASTRLPGKVLMKLGTKTVLDYVVARSRAIVGCEEVVVATSNNPQDDAIQDWCNHNEVSCFRGDEEDVLSRYYKCASQYHPDYILRVTADCPFVDYHEASNFIARMKSKGEVDAVILEGEFLRGIDVDIISYQALEHIYQVATEPRHKEHVTYFAFEYPERFEILHLQVPEYWRDHPELRITIDTQLDYKLCSILADHFWDQILISTEEVICFLSKNPSLVAINANIKQKPVV